MPALTTGTYGKATTMATAVLTDFADRMTAALQAGIGAVNDLNADVATGAPVSQASVNTLLKVMQDLGQVATDARQAAMDEIAANQPAPTTGGADPGDGTAPASDAPAAPDSGASATGSGTSTGSSSVSAKTGSGSTAKS